MSQFHSSVYGSTPAASQGGLTCARGAGFSCRGGTTERVHIFTGASMSPTLFLGFTDLHDWCHFRLTLFCFFSSFGCSLQLIHTISVVDRDEPQSGHRFFFTLAPEASSDRHFTLWDVKGECSCVVQRRRGFRRAVLMALSAKLYFFFLGVER